MKQTIRLTESQFKKVITESVKKVLREYDDDYREDEDAYYDADDLDDDDDDDDNSTGYYTPERLEKDRKDNDNEINLMKALKVYNQNYYNLHTREDALSEENLVKHIEWLAKKVFGLDY